MAHFNFTDSIYTNLLSEKFKARSETSILIIAIISFVLHLGLITLVDLEFIKLESPSKLLSNPISAIYTPFSFILIYEVYLLIYHLPKSTSTYIGKQYEIVTLIVIRKVFKDLSELVITKDWFNVRPDVQFTYDLLATLVLFFFIYLFYRLNQRRLVQDHEKGELMIEDSLKIERFIRQKKTIAACLIPIFFGLALFSLFTWTHDTFFVLEPSNGVIKDINKIFFDEFFTILILADVLLLLFSFLHTDEFNKIMRNSGFVISTILIKLSFGVEGVFSTLVLVAAVAFGLVILAIHNQFEKLRELQRLH
jgi:hypothetical protein